MAAPQATGDGYKSIVSHAQARAIAELLLAKGWEWQATSEPDDMGWLYMAKSCLYGAENDECLIALHPSGTYADTGEFAPCSRGEPRWEKLSLCCAACLHQADSTNPDTLTTT